MVVTLSFNAKMDLADFECNEVVEISHVLMLISHVFVCLHMLMRFHYKLE